MSPAACPMFFACSASSSQAGGFGQPSMDGKGDPLFVLPTIRRLEGSQQEYSQKGSLLSGPQEVEILWKSN